MTAITGVGVHVPRYRLAAETVADAWGRFEAAGVETVAIAGPDEDALTMAVEAAARALDAAGIEAGDVSAATVGTTTPPLDESDLTGHFVAMLGLPATVESAVFTGSTRAGTRAIRSAAALRDGPALAVAADCPVGPPDDGIGQGAGAGAVAFLLEDDGPATIGESASVSRAYPGTRYRERGADQVRTYGATSYERRAYTETIAEAVAELDGEVRALAPSAPDGSMPYRAAGAIDGDVEGYQRARSLGDTGAASPFFGLLEAWAAGEDDVVVAGYGDGASVDAIRILGSVEPEERASDPVDLDYPGALRIRGDIVSQGGGR